MLLSNLLILATAALGAVVQYDDTQYDGLQYDSAEYDSVQYDDDQSNAQSILFPVVGHLTRPKNSVGLI